MRILFLGDVVGKAGRNIVSEKLPNLIKNLKLDFVIINGENASHGRGLTQKHFNELVAAGADVVTLGDHAFDQKETLSFIEREQNLLRPINMPKGTPGRGATLVKAGNGQQILVVQALGRIFMNPIDCPFLAVEEAIIQCPLREVADAIVVDFHAEASSEIQAMGHFLDGRVSLVVGTHTHIPTADERILTGGTGLMTDAGMCGDYDSVIGMQIEEPLNRFLTGIIRERFEPAEKEASLSGVMIETDEKSGLCEKIEPIRIGGSLRQSAAPY